MRLSQEETGEASEKASRNEEGGRTFPLESVTIASTRDPLGLHETSGGGEIRTLERLAASPVFKTGAIGRSATPPEGNYRPVGIVDRLADTGQAEDVRKWAAKSGRRGNYFPRPPTPPDVLIVSGGFCSC